MIVQYLRRLSIAVFEYLFGEKGDDDFGSMDRGDAHLPDHHHHDYIKMR